MQQDLVSIIVTTYKRPAYLRKTLLSILNQTYRNIEIFVVTDGFSDEDRDVCAALNDGRLHHLQMEHAGRPAVPRNLGLRHAQGVYVAFCDDDDLWLPDKIKQQVGAFAQDPSSVLCYTNVSYIDEHDQPIESVSDRSTDFDAHLHKNNITFSSVMVRRVVMRDVPGFDERMVIRASEDYLFLARILAKFKFSYVASPLLQYRIHRQGISYARNSNLKMLRYYRRIVLCLWTLYREQAIGMGKFLCLLGYHGQSVLKIILYPYVRVVKNILTGKENV